MVRSKLNKNIFFSISKYLTSLICIHSKVGNNGGKNKKKKKKKKKIKYLKRNDNK